MIIFVKYVLGGFVGLPSWAKYAMFGAALALGHHLWLGHHDRALIRDYEAKVTAEVEKRKAAADSVAIAAGKKTIEEVELENEKARTAADGSADPLRAAFECLRTGTC